MPQLSRRDDLNTAKPGSCVRKQALAVSLVARVAPNPHRVDTHDHDTQKRGAACFGRDDIDDGSLGLEFHPHLPKCLEGLDSCGLVVLLIHLCLGCFSVMAFFFVFHRAQS